MSSPFTLGIEEEFQMVNPHTNQLASYIHPLMDKGERLFGEKMKPEMLQSTVELITGVCPNIAAARLEVTQLRTMLAQLIHQEGLALISGGTHPLARWQDQDRTDSPRYIELEDEFQDVGRSILIFGMHVHVGIESRELSINIMNQVRTWLPHILALSSNSPFWGGRFTGLKSYRTVVWKRFPRSGMPDVFLSIEDYDRYVNSLIRTGCIDNGKKIWWDIRPHPFFPTIEFRICDMPATLEDTLALAALCQALVAKLTWLYKHGMEAHTLPRGYIEENKWRAMRYGLDAEVIDFVNYRTLSMRDAIHGLLDFVDDVVDDLGSRREMYYLRRLLDGPDGTGADRQIAVYHETGSIEAVVEHMVHQTMQGISLDSVQHTLAS